MSMIYWVRGLSTAQIGALRAAPALAGDLVIVTLNEGFAVRFAEAARRMPEDQRRQFEAATKSARSAPGVREAGERLAHLGPLEQPLSLEKSWHMLHYLVTGQLGPAGGPGDLLLTGEELGEDVGYGRPRLHRATATREFSQFLTTLDAARLQARVDIGEMRRLQVYAIPEGPGSDAELENVLRDNVGAYFPRLRDYVATMSDKGNGLLTWIS